jgi:phosphate-selective porin OprO/OprP
MRTPLLAALTLAVSATVLCAEAVAQVETSTTGAEPSEQIAPEPSPPARQEVEVETRKEPTTTVRDQAAEDGLPASAPVVSGPHGPIRGFDVLRGSEVFRLRIGGTVQFDGRLFPGTDPRRPIHTFFPGRIRPILEGDLWRFVTFRLMPDFSAGVGATTLEEAWIDLELDPALHVRLGKAKSNFGLERLQGETDLWFIERSQVTNLIPNRDVGAQVLGTLFHEAIEYSAGVWNGVPDNAGSTSLLTNFDSDRKKDVIGRIFLRPFRFTSIELLHDIGIGIAGSHGVRRGSPKNPELPSYKTPAQQALFTYNADAMTTAAGTAWANGNLDRFSPQLYAYVGPVGLMAEYAHVSQDVAQGSSQATLIHDAYQATLAVTLTGERQSYRSIAVERPASFGEGRWGALELVLRYDHSNYSKAALGTFADGTRNWNGADAVWGGLNWYLNDNVKLSGQYVHSWFNGNSTVLLDTEDAVIVQAQLAI